MGGITERLDGKPQILMKRTGSSRPLNFPDSKPPILMKRTGSPKPLNMPGSKPQILMKRTSSSKPLNIPGPPTLSNEDILILDGPRNLQSWVEQTNRMAEELNCLDALKPHKNVPRGITPMSVSGWLRKERTEIAQHIILDRITPAVFAYMRVLGYNGICGKNAAETFEYAKLAANRMHIPENTGKQVTEADRRASEEEIDRMIWEWRSSKRDSYPQEISYNQAMEWLGKMLRRMAETNPGLREKLKAFEQQDRELGHSVPLTESDVPEKLVGKRKCQDEEVESSDDNTLPCRPRKRQVKKSYSADTDNRTPLVSGKEEVQAPSTRPKVSDSTKGPTRPQSQPYLLPQRPDSETTGEKP